MQLIFRIVIVVLAMWGAAAEAQTALPGHGGPIRAVAADGMHIVSGSFDGTAIVWPEGIVLRGHEGAINAVALMADGSVVTGGADGRVLLQRFGREAVEIMHDAGPVAALATQGDAVASASWDGTVRLWRQGVVQIFSGHDGNVNGVAFAPDGTLVSAGYDGTLRRWSLDGTAAVLRLGVPQNAVLVSGDNQLLAAGADGVLRLIRDGDVVQVVIDTVPLTSLALSHDGARIAAISLGGVAMIVSRPAAQIVAVLNGSEKPLWGVAFAGDEVVTGGAARVLKRWDVGSGRMLGLLGAAPVIEPIRAAPGTEPGAQIFRACQACHSLRADDVTHAGPTLHGLFGRRVGSVPGFDYSAALRGMDLVWTPETVARLFTVGPQSFLPGTRMPEQVVSLAADREALMRFLEQATR